MSPTFVMPIGLAARRAALLADARSRVGAARCAAALAARTTHEPAVRDLLVAVLSQLDEAGSALHALQRAEGI